MQIGRWGNSFAVRLSKDMVDAMGLKPDDELDIVAATDTLLTVQHNQRRRAALARMRARKWQAPSGFRFDRDEANAR
jgi:antitoxin MazE